jgi:hypothetical protein
MKCGKCKESGPHISVDHVRGCYQGKTTSEVQAERLADGTRPYRPQVSGNSNPPTDKMVNYVLGLQDERDCSNLPHPLRKPYTESDLRGMDYVDVSDLIGVLKGMPFKEGNGKCEWSMPAGRYALLKDEQWRFYQVDKPTEGKWRGYVFLKQLFGAPGDYRKESIRNHGVRNAILAAIDEDPRTAAIDYGMQSQTCSLCSSPLTNPDSIAAGIGPVCRGKVGW